MNALHHFKQSWLAEPEATFHPGSVAISCVSGKLNLHAVLDQPRVHTSATAHQQRLWELGDVFELFVQKKGNSDYYEYQITPNGMMLALHYPDREAVSAVRSGERNIEEFLSELPMEGSASITPECWKADIGIRICANEGDRLLINCGRYDYSSGTTPVVSSISPLSKRDFHRLDEWLLLE